MNFKEFKYNSLEEVIQDAESMNLDLKFSNNMQLFHKKVNVNGTLIPNSLAFHPMEGTDGKTDEARMNSHKKV